MCTRTHIAIKSVSKYSPKFGDVPCGQCAECRQVKKNEWTFRLRVELEALVKSGWQVGFVTMTYNDENLPHIPLWFCKDSFQQETSMCFSREDVTQFIKNMRNWCYRKYGLKKDVDAGPDNRFRFMVCSEFGEKTKRSHYHALFAFPPVVDARKFYEQIKRQWLPKGFIFPRYFEGGRDAHGYEHKPFLVDTVSAACAYCSKYCCKDLSYFSSIDWDNYFKKVTDWENEEDKLSRYMPFHCQSRSLGAAWLDGLNADEKISALIDGVSFVGDDRLRSVPQYLKNKILYNNYYRFNSDGKRICRKQANDFLRKNYVQIFDKKCKKLEETLQGWNSFEKDDFEKSLSSRFDDFRTLYVQFKPFFGKVARDFVAYGGVWYGHCNDVNRPRFWLNRYLCYDDGLEVHDVEIYSFDDAGRVQRDSSVLPVSYLVALNRFFFLGNFFENLKKRNSNVLKLALERRIQSLKELYFHEVG